MAATVQFWFEYASTYSYLSAMRIAETAAQRNVDVEWCPFLLGPIFAEQGWTTSPFNIYPAKGRYMWRDMQRICAARNLPLQKPDPFPQNSLIVARLALAIPQHAQRADFTRAVYTAEFGYGRDISDTQVLAACLETAGISADILNRTTDPDIKQALFDQTARASDHGIFGAPSFVSGDELFWGDDRLDDAIHHAATI
ncbi:MAG: 2-hydroxychromene-2-carboxylate isomerase [Pseudomonadota bacterium]